MTKATAASEFLARNDLPPDSLEKSGLKWDDLLAIGDAHRCRTGALERAALGVVSVLQSCPNIHSTRYRIKSPESLMAKSVRLMVEDPTRQISLDNYGTVVTDLVGLRALHVSKCDWSPIHSFVLENWSLLGPATAKHRKGDPEPLLEEFRLLGCNVVAHGRGYRSVHYLFSVRLTNKPITIELQVRTLFEEVWSEIDHSIRYKRARVSPIIGAQLDLFNLMAGFGDMLANLIGQTVTELSDLDCKYKDLERRLEDDIARISKNSGKGNYGDAVTSLRETVERLTNLERGRGIGVSDLTERTQLYQNGLTGLWARLEANREVLLRQQMFLRNPTGVGGKPKFDNIEPEEDIASPESESP